MKAVDLVTIEQLIPIFKNGEPANAIEVARVKDSEGTSIQYDIIVGKGLYKIGDDAIYIQPDYTIPFTPIFKEYYAPGGETNKSKLGKKGRVKAIKFNFQFEGSTEPIYSNGIIIPFDEFQKWFSLEFKKDDSKLRDIPLPYNIDEVDNIESLLTGVGVDLFIAAIDFKSETFPYQEVLGIEKYVADDSLDGSQPSGMTKGTRPSFLYKTDEETIENHKKEIDRCFENNEILTFSRKCDGSSCTTFFRINPIENAEEFGICSRDLEKKLDQNYVVMYVNDELEQTIHPYFNRDTQQKGWFNDTTQTFYATVEEAEKSGFKAVMGIQKDAWVDTDKKYGYLEKLITFCKDFNVQLALRGELIGQGNKGSGKKHNSDAKTEARVVWFGVDDLSGGQAKRISYASDFNLKNVCEKLGFEYAEELFSGVFSYDQIIAKAHEYFKMMEEMYGIIVEGVVVRTKFSNNLSVKVLNYKYDEKS